MKVLYASGYTDDAVVRGLVQGTAFVQKPFRPGDLERLIRELLDEPAES